MCQHPLNPQALFYRRCAFNFVRRPLPNHLKKPGTEYIGAIAVKRTYEAGVIDTIERRCGVTGTPVGSRSSHWGFGDTAAVLRFLLFLGDPIKKAIHRLGAGVCADDLLGVRQELFEFGRLRQSDQFPPSLLADFNGVALVDSGRGFEQIIAKFVVQTGGSNYSL
jgi:hypothetical protein